MKIYGALGWGSGQPAMVNMGVAQLSGTTEWSDKKPSMTARSRWSRGRFESAVEFAPQAVNVLGAVGHVFAILPHASERRIANGTWPSGRRLRGHIHLNERTLLNLHLLKRPEDAIFVLRGDCHGFDSEYTP